MTCPLNANSTFAHGEIAKQSYNILTSSRNNTLDSSTSSFPFLFISPPLVSQLDLTPPRVHDTAASKVPTYSLDQPPQPYIPSQGEIVSQKARPADTPNHRKASQSAPVVREGASIGSGRARARNVGCVSSSAWGKTSHVLFIASFPLYLAASLLAGMIVYLPITNSSPSARAAPRSLPTLPPVFHQPLDYLFAATHIFAGVYPNARNCEHID